MPRIAGNLFAMWIWIILIFGLVAGIAYFVLRLPSNVFRLYTRPIRLANDRNPGMFGLRYDNLAFEVNGIILQSWIIYPPDFHNGENRPGVLMLHGIAANRSDILERSAAVALAGYIVFSFDHRAHGDSSGKLCSGGILEVPDTLEVLKMLRERKELQSDRIGVYGFSMGASVGIMVAARDGNIPCVVADSPYSSLWSITADMLRLMRLPVEPVRSLLDARYRKAFGAGLHDVDITDAIEKLDNNSVLLISGRKDKLVPHHHAQTLLKSMPEPRNHYFTEGGHFDNGSPEILKEVVIPFIKRKLPLD